MKISIIMAACNQGDYLKETVASALVGLQGCKDWEILIMDDKSDDDCVQQVYDAFPDLTDSGPVHNTPIKIWAADERLGVSHARNFLGTQATGDVIMTTDTHCLYPRRSIWRMAKCWASKKWAVIMPRVEFELDDGKSKHIPGGRLTLCERGLRIDRPSVRPRFPAMFGSMYLMRRDVWEHLGGWMRLPGYWGGEEQIMTLLAYRLGVPILVVDHHTWTHRRYRAHARYPFELPPHHVPEIAHYIHAACLPNAYESTLRTVIERHYGYGGQADPAPLRDWIENRAVWSEAKFTKIVLGLDNVKDSPVIQRYLRKGSRKNALQKTSASVHANEPSPVAPGHVDN